MGLELNFTFALEHITELIVLGERCSVAVDKFRVVEKNICNGKCFSPRNNEPYPATQVAVPWFISH